MKGNTPLPYTIFLLPLLITILLSSCEDCYQCGIVQPEPYFNVKFINEDALKKVEDTLKYLETNRSITNDSIDSKERARGVKQDTLVAIEDSLRQVTLSREIDSLTATIDSLRGVVNEIRLSKTREERIKNEI